MFDDSANGLFDAEVISDVHLEDVERERFPFGEISDFGGVRSVAAADVAHGGKHGVAVAGKSLGKETAKASAGAGDEDYVFGSHGCLLESNMVNLEK
jgi:hypothetical protein